MNAFHRNKNKKCGVTLIELLVVVTILMMLAAFAIPAMRPLTEGRRIREATRAIDVFITQAKIRAAEIQRPVGVEFQRMTEIDFGDPTDPSDDTVVFDQQDACNVLRFVEVPSPYAGNFTNSRVLAQDWTIHPTTGLYYYQHPLTGRNQVVLKLLIQVSDFSDRLLRWGDRIQLNYQGPVFEIFDDETDNDPTDPTDTGRDFPVNPVDDYIMFARDPALAVVGSDSNNDGWIDNYVLSVRANVDEVGAVPWPYRDPAGLNTTDPAFWSIEVPFQVFRQPEPSPLPPLRLPKNTVIDLGDSGYFDTTDAAAFSGNGLFPDAFGFVGGAATQRRGPMVVFAPNGAISYVYHWDTAGSYGSTRVTRPIFLMVGKLERTGAEPVSAGSPVRSLAEDQLHNWQDASNLWMAISPLNGMVTSAEVNAQDVVQSSGTAVPGDPTGAAYPDPTDPTSATDPAQLARQMYSSRAYARQAQISKGALAE